jgi:hypothetical protein
MLSKDESELEQTNLGLAVPELILGLGLDGSCKRLDEFRLLLCGKVKSIHVQVCDHAGQLNVCFSITQEELRNSLTESSVGTKELDHLVDAEKLCQDSTLPTVVSVGALVFLFSLCTILLV